MRYCLWILLCLTSRVVANTYCPEQISVSASWLYWSATQKGSDYTTRPSSVFATTNFADSSLVAATNDWESGFRLALDSSYASPWSVGLHITNYHGSAHGSKTAATTEGLFPTLSFANDTLPSDYVTSARIQGSLHTVLVDIVGARLWYSDGRLSLTPSISLRNAWITQRVSASYFGATFTAGADQVSLHSSFYGVGPRVGVKPKYWLGNGLSVYGEAAGAVLYGRFHAHQKETFLAATRASLNSNPHGLRWNADLTAGLSWEQSDGYTADLGFDFLYFSKQYAFKHGSQFSLRDQDKGLFMYGMHLSAGLCF